MSEKKIKKIYKKTKWTGIKVKIKEEKKKIPTKRGREWKKIIIKNIYIRREKIAITRALMCIALFTFVHLICVVIFIYYDSLII